jgi:hypothetical protein
VGERSGGCCWNLVRGDRPGPNGNGVGEAAGRDGDG